MTDPSAPPDSPKPPPEVASEAVPGAAPGQTLSPAARRALLEAEARRRTALAMATPTEAGGPSDLEPTRFGDWERKGLAVDF